MTNTTRSAEHGSFTINRTYPVPPERVFAAWSSPEAKARWFGAPGGDPGYTLDFRVGGREINRGGPPDGPVFTYEATYRDIVPAERIVYGYVMERDDTLISVSVTTVEFAPTASGTTLTFTEQGVFLDGGDTTRDSREGHGRTARRPGGRFGLREDRQLRGPPQLRLRCAGRNACRRGAENPLSRRPQPEGMGHRSRSRLTAPLLPAVSHISTICPSV